MFAIFWKVDDIPLGIWECCDPKLAFAGWKSSQSADAVPLLSIRDFSTQLC